MHRFATRLPRPLLLAALVLVTMALAGAASAATTSQSPANKARTHARRATTHTAKTVSAKPAPATTVAAAPTAPAPTAAGMRIYRDPETGAIGTAPAGELTDFSNQLGPVADPVITTHADGSVEMLLNGNGEEYAIISMGWNGVPAFRCVQGPRSAKAATQAPAPAAAPREDR